MFLRTFRSCPVSVFLVPLRQPQMDSSLVSDAVFLPLATSPRAGCLQGKVFLKKKDCQDRGFAAVKMTTKAAALAIRKGEQKGAIAEKKAAHERVFDLLLFYIHCCALSITEVVALLAPLAEFNQPP